MATAASIRVVKQFTYRGVLRNFSNRYHFTGGAPSDSTHWTTLSDAIVTAEKAIFIPLANWGAKIIATVGYAGGSEIPVFNKTYTTDGTGTWTSVLTHPGDVANLIRYSTADRSSKNHPIYLFNYYHSAQEQGTVGGADLANAAQRTAMGTYASSWISGFSDGTTNHIRSRPNGNAATGSLVEANLTHRDLPH
jgi:hypothetical protein